MFKYEAKYKNTDKAEINHHLNTITIPLEVYKEMQYYIDEFDTECSGLGLVERKIHQIGEGNDQCFHNEFIINEIFLPNQTNTSVSTDIEDEFIHGIIHKLVEEGKPTESLRLHWHSHVDMAVYVSKTDQENYDELRPGDWGVQLILNKARDILARVDHYKPYRMTFEGIPVFIAVEDEDTAIAQWQGNVERVLEYEEANKVYTPAPYKPPVHGGPNYSNQAYDSSSLYNQEESPIGLLDSNGDPLSEVKREKPWWDKTDSEEFFKTIASLEKDGELEILRDSSGTAYGYRDLVSGKNYEIDVTEMGA